MGKSAQFSFASKISGEFLLIRVPPNQQILRLKNKQNSPKSGKIRRANLNCADLSGSPVKISTGFCFFPQF
jgi:hypothetical protein